MLKFYHAINLGNVTFIHVMDAGHAEFVLKRKCIFLCTSYMLNFDYWLHFENVFAIHVSKHVITVLVFNKLSKVNVISENVLFLNFYICSLDKVLF